MTDPALSPTAHGAAAGGSAGVDDLNYEQARDELIRVVQQLEAGTTSLEQSISLWERGEALAARCESWLVGARERLERAKRDIES